MFSEAVNCLLKAIEIYTDMASNFRCFAVLFCDKTMETKSVVRSATQPVGHGLSAPGVGGLRWEWG